MKISGWRYYNHAAIPTCHPHEEPDVLPIENGSIWKIDGGRPLLARWTTDFDCGSETNWWYVIKDTPFDISTLKAKRRYEINKGIKNFQVVEIKPTDYAEQLYTVQVAAFSAYPKKYRPIVDKELFLSGVKDWSQKYVVMGAFLLESNELCGYALIAEKSGNYAAFNVLKTKPEQEKNGINAALVNGVLTRFSELVLNGGYICDGERSISHETAFQDYLEKYFGFRKAYCKLHIAYSSKARLIVKMLYPFRRLFSKVDGIGIVHQLNAVFRMEEMVRNEQ